MISLLTGGSTTKNIRENDNEINNNNNNNKQNIDTIYKGNPILLCKLKFQQSTNIPVNYRIFPPPKSIKYYFIFLD